MAEKSRNVKGDGSWTKLKSGWQNRIVYKNTVKKFSGKTKDEVRQKRKEWINEIDKTNGNIVISSTKPLSEYMAEWVKIYIRPSKSRQTGDTYETTIKRIEKNQIAKIPICSLSSSDLQNFINSLAFEKPHYKKETVDKTYNHLNACLRFAVENKELYTNPMSVVNKIPQRNFPEQSQPAPFTIFDDGDMKKIVAEAKAKHGKNNKYSYGQHIIFLMYTGLRIGEALALQWKDVDLSTNLLKINKSLSLVKSIDLESKNKTEYIIGDTKTTSSNREILIFNIAHNALINIKDSCKNISGEGYVFQTSSGNIQGRRNINRCLKSIQINANTTQQGLSVHDLRHTFCSYCARNNMQAMVLKEYVGHGDISITNKYYIHTTSTQIKNSIDKMNNIIGKS